MHVNTYYKIKLNFSNFLLYEIAVIKFDIIFTCMIPITCLKMLFGVHQRTLNLKPEAFTYRQEPIYIHAFFSINFYQPNPDKDRLMIF